MRPAFSSSAWSPLDWWSDLKVGLIFLTRLPLRHGAEIGGPALSRAVRAFPLVGVVVGVGGGAAFGLASWLGLPPLPSALVAVAATVLVTGALHEDGLADVADGFGGGGDRARKLEIMRDSRIGTFGGLALVLSVALRASVLAALAEPWSVLLALVAAHALARAMLPGVMSTLPLARDDGLAAESDAPPPSQAAIAFGLGLLAALLTLGPGTAVAAAAAAALAAWAMARLARRQVGGYTGDVLGSVEQMGEIAVLLTIVAMA
jgi:adenosylcobinamide-GDP ribazoletransferase